MLSWYKNAYLIALAYNQELARYYSAFLAALSITTGIRRLYKDTLPDPPRTYRQIRSHIHATEFQAACNKEIKALFDKDMFIYINKSKVFTGIVLLPLIWVFTYKFNKDRYLNKHKACLIAQGDLQVDQDNIYIATLAA